MASKQKAQAGVKVKKKVWVSILAPKMFNEIVVGETPADSAQATVGKVVTVNMMTLTGDARKQSINAKLKIMDVKEGKAFTKLIKYEINPSAIKRLVRRNKERIDESLVYQTKDGVKVRIKPFILTINQTRSSTVAEIRKRLKVFLYKTIAQTTYDDLFKLVIENRIQKEIGMSISKLYPLKNVEIRVMHIEKDDAKITPPPMLRERPKEEEEKVEEKEEVAAEESESMPEEQAEEETQAPAKKKSSKKKEDVSEE